VPECSRTLEIGIRERALVSRFGFSAAFQRITKVNVIQQEAEEAAPGGQQREHRKTEVEGRRSSTMGVAELEGSRRSMNRSNDRSCAHLAHLARG